MVKILQAYNFAKQNTYSLNVEILTATLIDDNRIAITTAEQCIEIYELDNDENSFRETENDATFSAKGKQSECSKRTPKKYAMPTVGDVVNLNYCKEGKYLLTLEKENVDSPMHAKITNISCTSSSNPIANDMEEEKKMFVRIYANFWKFSEQKLADMPITIRIASMTTPKAQLLESIDVIELPLRSYPHLTQCCQISGNILVSCKDRIYLFEYTECVHENTQPRFSFIDFLPFKFYVSLNFTPLKLCLAENVIACMNNRYCVAFKIVDVMTEGNGNRSSNGNCLNSDYDEHDFEEEIDESEIEEIDISKASGLVSAHSNNSYELDSLSSSTNGRIVGANAACLHGTASIDFDVARIVNSAYGRDFEVDLKSQWDRNNLMTENATSTSTIAQEILICPTRSNDIKIKLVNEANAANLKHVCNPEYPSIHYNNDKIVQYDIRKLLQIHMQSSEPNGKIVDTLRCMDLKAIYQRSDQIDEHSKSHEMYVTGNQQVPSAVTTLKHANCRTLKSSMYHCCIGFSLFVASSVDGYLYQFSAQGRWYKENEKPIATYSFTAPVLHVHINDYVIYATTTESVETHTSRIGHKLFNNRFEYPMVNGLFPEESSPDVNTAIAVIGLCSFINIHFVCVNQNNLVLITNSALPLFDGASVHTFAANKKRVVAENKKNIAARLLAEAKAKHSLLRSGNVNHNSPVNDWTLYVLKVPSVENVVEDLEAIAETNRSASDSNFYALMEEAHVMLRLSLLLHSENLSPEREEQLRIKFIDNCRKLADFCIRSKKKEVYLQAIGFYKMCDFLIMDVYKSYVNSFLGLDKIIPDSEELVGFIYTIKNFLLAIGRDRHKIGCLNHLVEPFFTVADESKFNELVPLSLEIMHLFIKHSPEDITEIMLSCPLISDTISTEVISYLKQLENPNAEQLLLLAVIACRQSNFLLSKEVCNKMSRHNLATALINHKNVLFDDSTILYQKQSNSSQKVSNTSRRVMQHLIGKRKNSLKNQLSKNSVSFSEFTEVILLACEKSELIEGISDAFIHGLCIERTLSLDALLQEFLNFFASHIGQKGYQTSQNVLMNILQVYYYDIFDVTFVQNVNYESTSSPFLNEDMEEAVSLTCDCDKDNQSTQLDDSSSSSPPGIFHTSKQNRIVYEELSQQNSLSQNNSAASITNIDMEETNQFKRETDLKGLKILFRMYLGRLKALCDTKIENNESGNGDAVNMRSEYITFMLRYLQKLRNQQQNCCKEKTECYYSGSNKNTNADCNTDRINERIVFVPYIPNYKLSEDEYQQHIENYLRPIPCLTDRPQYLNRLPPFKRSDFSSPSLEEGDCEVRFLKWNNELLTLTLKIQSILACKRICREIIEEFIAFVHKLPFLIGIDSFLVLILPKNAAIDFMINLYPEHLWAYGKSNGFQPKHWQSLFQKHLNKREEIENWKPHISDILNNLVAEMTFEQLLQCFPVELTTNRTNISFHKEFDRLITNKDNNLICFVEESEECLNGTLERNHIPMDNTDESNVFEMALRKAVAKQRSIALRAMIESTGSQLLDATNSSMYNL